MMRVHAFRSRLKEWGSSWTFYIKLRHWFLEINVGRDL